MAREFVRAVAKEYLGYQDNNNLCKTDQQEGQTELKLEDIINFVVDVVLRNTSGLEKTILWFDDVHLMDSLSWTIF